jgi:hypothetical protein
MVLHLDFDRLAPFAMDGETAGGREASRSRAFDSPWEGEHMEVRTARPIEEYSPRPFQRCGEGLLGSSERQKSRND